MQTNEFFDIPAILNAEVQRLNELLAELMGVASVSLLDVSCEQLSTLDQEGASQFIYVQRVYRQSQNGQSVSLSELQFFLKACDAVINQLCAEHPGFLDRVMQKIGAISGGSTPRALRWKALVLPTIFMLLDGTANTVGRAVIPLWLNVGGYIGSFAFGVILAELFYHSVRAVSSWESSQWKGWLAAGVGLMSAGALTLNNALLASGFSGLVAALGSVAGAALVLVHYIALAEKNYGVTRLLQCDRRAAAPADFQIEMPVANSRPNKNIGFLHPDGQIKPHAFDPVIGDTMNPGWNKIHQMHHHD